jgi:hypothetical protein
MLSMHRFYCTLYTDHSGVSEFGAGLTCELGLFFSRLDTARAAPSKSRTSQSTNFLIRSVIDCIKDIHQTCDLLVLIVHFGLLQPSAASVAINNHPLHTTHNAHILEQHRACFFDLMLVRTHFFELRSTKHQLMAVLPN